MTIKAKTYDPDRQIIVIWSIDDVQTLRPDLTDDQAFGVLQEAGNHHDACIGINWGVLECLADWRYPKEMTPLEKLSCRMLEMEHNGLITEEQYETYRLLLDAVEALNLVGDAKDMAELTNLWEYIIGTLLKKLK